jgi:Flp pilus assembly protein protease CpaA
METVALTLVLFLAVVLIVVPVLMLAVRLARKVRARVQLHRMRRRWRANNQRRTITGISRPFTAILEATTSLRPPSEAAR